MYIFAAFPLHFSFYSAISFGHLDKGLSFICFNYLVIVACLNITKPRYVFPFSRDFNLLLSFVDFKFCDFVNLSWYFGVLDA